jgi:ADP-ribose pyrophosphatase YjhB (NUDIX family)
MAKENFKNRFLTLDAIIHNDKNQILFIKRKNDPYNEHF